MNPEEETFDSELECSVCNDLLYKPVSINCGHTFCRQCLGDIIKNKPQCPLCRTPCFLQENNFKENVTLRSLIEKKYPLHVQRRSEFKPQRPQTQEEVQNNIPEENIQEQNFNPMIVLPLHKGIKKQILPGLDNRNIVVRLNFDPEILKNVCQDKRILVVPDEIISQKSQYMTCIVEIKDLKPVVNSKDLYKVRVKFCERVMIKEYSSIEFDKKTLEDWGYVNVDQELLSLKVGKGVFIKDKIPSQGNLEQVKRCVEEIEEFWNEKINNWMKVSPESAKYVIKQMQSILQAGNDRNLEYFENFSFVTARLLKATEEEKRRMFETTNILERLVLLRRITQLFKNTTEFSVIVEMEFVGGNAFDILTILFILAPILSFFAFLFKVQ